MRASRPQASGNPRDIIRITLREVEVTRRILHGRGRRADRADWESDNVKFILRGKANKKKQRFPARTSWGPH